MSVKRRDHRTRERQDNCGRRMEKQPSAGVVKNVVRAVICSAYNKRLKLKQKRYAA